MQQGAPRRGQVAGHRLTHEIVGELIGMLPLLDEEPGSAGGVEPREHHVLGLFAMGERAQDERSGYCPPDDGRGCQHCLSSLR
jgi:hypothetical protein